MWGSRSLGVAPFVEIAEVSSYAWWSGLLSLAGQVAARAYGAKEERLDVGPAEPV